MRRLLGCCIAAVGVALALVVPAAAGPPEINHDRFAAVNEEQSAFLSELCGFEVIAFEDVVVTERFYADGSERSTVNQRITYTAGDQQLFEHNSYQFYFDADQEISRFTGVPFRIMDESGRVIFKDRGNVAFDRDGQIIWEHGPHPSLHDPGPSGGICDDLSE